MGYFKRKRERANRELAQVVAQAVVEAVGAGSKPKLEDYGSFYEKTLGGMATFLSGASDVAIRGAASALGQKGGRRTQQRRRERIEAQSRSAQPLQCRLCKDPLARNLTVDDILAHRKHEHGHTNPDPPEPTGAEQREQSGGVPLYGKQAIGFNAPD